MNGLTNTIGQFSHPSHGIVLNKFSYQPTVATKGMQQISIKATKSHMEKLSKAVDQFTPSTNNSSQKTVLQSKMPDQPVASTTKELQQRPSWIGKTYAAIVTNPLNQLSNSIHNSSQTLVLRGEVPFERWYYHYQSPSAIKGLGQLSSRVWACAHAIESAIKIIFIAFSLPYYVIKSTLAREMRYEALDSQICSFLFSSFAIIAPVMMRDEFKKEFNTLKYIVDRAKVLPFKYTRYTGDTTLKMLATAH